MISIKKISTFLIAVFVISILMTGCQAISNALVETLKEMANTMDVFEV